MKASDLLAGKAECLNSEVAELAPSHEEGGVHSFGYGEVNSSAAAGFVAASTVLASFASSSQEVSAESLAGRYCDEDDEVGSTVLSSSRSPSNLGQGRPSGFIPASQLPILPDTTCQQQAKPASLTPPTPNSPQSRAIITSGTEEEEGAMELCSNMNMSTIKGPTVSFLLELEHAKLASGSKNRKGKGPRGKRSEERIPKLTKFFESKTE